MKIFAAGSWSSHRKGFAYVTARVSVRHFLASAAYLRPAKARARCDEMRSCGVEELWLDCGSPSVKSGVAEGLALAEYERMVERVEPDAHFQLDVIGNAAATRRHLEQMRKDGFAPIPIFTKGAPWDDLRRLLEEGEDLIALGGVSSGRGLTSGTQAFLTGCFSIARRWQLEQGRPHPVRFHFLGVTQSAPLFDYPFFSSDSSGAVKAPGFGCLLTTTSTGQLKTRPVSLRQGERGRENAGRYPALVDLPGDSKYLDRMVESQRVLNDLEARLTKVWAMRGVEWDGHA